MLASNPGWRDYVIDAVKKLLDEDKEMYGHLAGPVKEALKASKLSCGLEKAGV